MLLDARFYDIVGCLELDGFRDVFWEGEVSIESKTFLLTFQGT
jgi:hypothetical protein